MINALTVCLLVLELSMTNENIDEKIKDSI
jgi:hypothetical protein